MPLSVYERCRVAALELIDDPSLRPITTGPPGLWTELDVIMRAGRNALLDGQPFSPDDMDAAHKQANEAMGKLWRSHEVVRFGPVTVPGFEEPDYMRITSRMAYASGDGPTEVVTPNGTFPRFFKRDDPIGRHGRRLGAARDDLTSWEEQEIVQVANRQTTAEEREITRLKVELSAAREREGELIAARERLRAMNAALLRLGRIDPDEVQRIEQVVASHLSVNRQTT